MDVSCVGYDRLLLLLLPQFLFDQFFYSLVSSSCFFFVFLENADFYYYPRQPLDMVSN